MSLKASLWQGKEPQKVPFAREEKENKTGALEWRQQRYKMKQCISVALITSGLEVNM